MSIQGTTILACIQFNSAVYNLSMQVTSFHYDSTAFDGNFQIVSQLFNGIYKISMQDTIFNE